jgi:hypothetical protein
MTRPCLAAALLLASAPTLAAEPAEDASDGRMDGEGVHVEILGKPVAVGERVDLPEGWFRVEEQGVEDRQVGSFSIVALADTAEPAGAARAEAPPGGPPCRAQRGAYLRELWKTSGVEVDDPDAVLEGLESGQGAATGYYWFALQTDPVRPMAWSSDLRDRARELARCVKEHRPAG